MNADSVVKAYQSDLVLVDMGVLTLAQARENAWTALGYTADERAAFHRIVDHA